jgi:hypothetical protein
MAEDLFIYITKTRKNNMKTSFKTNYLKMIAVVGVVAVSLAVCPAMAEQFKFMDINFNGDSSGSAPSTSPAPSPLTSATPITTVQAIGGYDSDPLPATDPGYKSPPTASCGTVVVGDVSGMSKASVMTTNSTDGEMGALWMDTGFSMTSSQLSLKFDINVLAAPTTATVQPKLLNNTTDQAGILFGINTFTSAGRGVCFAVAPTSENGGVFALRNAANDRLITFGNYVEGQTYNLAIAANFETGTADAYINDVLAVSDFPFWATGNSSAITTSEVFMHLNGESGYSNQLAIDNIQAFNYVVPEPGTLTLLASLIGVFSIGCVRRLFNR